MTDPGASSDEHADTLAQAIVGGTDPIKKIRATTYELAELFETDPDTIRDRLEEYPWAHAMDDDGIEWAFDRHVVFSDSIEDAIESYPHRYDWGDFRV